MDRLWQAMALPDMLDLMRQEGLSAAEGLSRDYLQGRPGQGWQADIDRIFDPIVMHSQMRDAFEADFAGVDPAPVADFFESDLGRRITKQEIATRRAFLDPRVEAEARAKGGAGTAARQDLINAFIAVNDLVSFNMSGALNTSVAFMTGLAQAETFQMSESDILARVYADVEKTQTETEEWLRAYLSNAFSTLSDDDLVTYIAMSDTPEGRRLNRALFAGYSAMYVAQYRALGVAVARQIGAQDI